MSWSGSLWTSAIEYSSSNEGIAAVASNAQAFSATASQEHRRNRRRAGSGDPACANQGRPHRIASSATGSLSTLDDTDIDLWRAEGVKISAR
jgi:hypothetical protein